MERLKNWLKGRHSSADQSSSDNLRHTGARVSPSRPKISPTASGQKAAQDRRSTVHDRRSRPDSDESGDADKNRLIRNKYVREDTGTHETLKILDDSLVDSGEETGIDPYNTGGFDRSKNWNDRFRK